MNSARLTAFLLLVLDAAAVGMVFNVLAWIRGISEPGSWITLPLLGPLALLAVAVYLIDGYDERTDMLSLDYTSLHGIALVAATVGTLLLTFVIIPANYPLQGSRAVILLGFAACLPLSLGYRRFFYLRYLQRQRLRHLLFVGDRVSCEAFQSECALNAFDRKIIYAHAGPQREAPDAPQSPHLRRFSDCLEEIQKGQSSVEAIILSDSSHALPTDVSDILDELYFQGVPTYTLAHFHQLYWRKISLAHINQVWLFQEGFRIAREPVFLRLKRLVDLILAGTGLILFGWVIALAMLGIRLTDGSPSLFKQRRIGKNRIPFTVYKLRTMRLSPADGTLLPDEERITRFGRFLRASRLDEFPQLWNVVRGEMSLIGPRAEWEANARAYENAIPCYHFRHLVKPGITGWAQVNYPYGTTLDNTRRKLEYDLYYIRHFSFILDASIVLKTIHTILAGKGR